MECAYRRRLTTHDVVKHYAETHGGVVDPDDLAEFVVCVFAAAGDADGAVSWIEADVEVEPLFRLLTQDAGSTAAFQWRDEKIVEKYTAMKTDCPSVVLGFDSDVGIYFVDGRHRIAAIHRRRTSRVGAIIPEKDWSKLKELPS